MFAQESKGNWTIVEYLQLADGVVQCGVHSTVLRTFEPSDRASDNSNLISAMNDAQSLVVEMRSELSDARSDGLEVCTMVKCTTKQKKKGGSGNRILRDSQGTQEDRHIIEGATSTPPTQPSTNHVEGMSMVAAQPTQLPCIATNNEGLNCTAPRKPRKGGRLQSNTKRTRGITRGLGVQKRLRAEGKIGGVYFPDDKWKPMGRNAQVYTTENEMIKLKNQPVPEGETPMTEDQICDKVLGRAIGYVRGLGYGVRPDTSIKVAHAMRGQLQECTKWADEAERRAELAEQRAEVAEKWEEVAEKRA
ncbi:hypothetical protein RHMOL_Rhmol09G0077700 [Rhododendron molle]|uniref:Uncharacterized protein n=1 Tax=Rhododendron molle TaxID=49168 RepID=A0ACC0MAX7_RHOML|nr:hypothetical protein RHMOL_Rhmol09G0077700 [Rhododendron molle]